MMENPLKIDPHSPNIRSPDQASVKPAIGLPIIPLGTSFPIIKPAIHPIIPLIINIYNICIKGHLFIKRFSWLYPSKEIN
jgi:hypothetical protein